VDLGVPDLNAGVEFYGALFGWQPVEGPALEGGDYRQMELGGKIVAGLGLQQSPDIPPYWTVYVSVANAEISLEHVVEAGGTVIVEPMDIFELGRMGVAQDINGAFISVWQPGSHFGCELVNETGAFGWNELAATDIAAARGFYTNVFGWGLDPSGRDESAVFTVDGEVVCGAHAAGEGEFPAWSVWFGADDCDASVAAAVELGATVVMPPMDMSFGRGAMVADPFGAVFGVASNVAGI
jgi:uncharacterized protein